MFQLAREEYSFLKCQLGTLRRRGHSTHPLVGFIEQGIASFAPLSFWPLEAFTAIELPRFFSKTGNVMGAPHF